MTIKIQYSKSRSANYRKVVRLCKAIGQFEEGEQNILTVTPMQIFEHWDKFNTIFHLAKKWASFSVVVDDKEYSAYNDISRFFYAIQEVKNCYRGLLIYPTGQESYCKGDWSCRRLRTIGVNTFGRLMWYHVGEFVSENVFRVNKEHIKLIVLDDINKQHLHVCPAFNLQSILNRIDGLPDQVDRTKDPNWSVRSRIQLRDDEYKDWPTDMDYSAPPEAELDPDHWDVDDLLRKILNTDD